MNWEYNEISLTLEAEKAASASSGWYELVRTPGNRKRCLLIILTAIFSQCSGNGLVSYYLAAVLQTIGITNSSDQALINGGLTIWCWLVSLGCAFLVDRVGRRTLFLSAGIGMLIHLDRVQRGVRPDWKLKCRFRSSRNDLPLLWG